MADEPFRTVGPIADDERRGDRITEVWAWCVVDPVDNNEGVIAITGALGPTPLIGADRDRIESFRDYAKTVARATDCPVTLARFTERIDVEVLEP